MDDLETSVEYDRHGAITKLTYPSGRVVDTSRDALGGMKVISDSGSTIADYNYLGAKHVESRSHGNGTTLSYNYDALGRVKETKHVHTSRGTPPERHRNAARTTPTTA